MLFKITRKEALKFDLLVCACGHRPNNHFEFRKKPCAHCSCKKYAEKPRVGRLIKEKKVKKDYSWFEGEVDKDLVEAIRANQQEASSKLRARLEYEQDSLPLPEEDENIVKNGLGVLNKKALSSMIKVVKNSNRKVRK